MSKIKDRLVEVICDSFEVNFEDIKRNNIKEDKVPGRYAIRLFIGRDWLDFAVRNAIVGKPFNVKKDVIETNFDIWPPSIMELNDIFERGM